jgi:hypothetical protein
MQLFTLSIVLFTLAVLTSSADVLLKNAYVPAKDLNNLAKLMPPSSLPSPDGLALKYVLLGIGTQNYTCTTGDENETPNANGAVGEKTSLISLEHHLHLISTFPTIRCIANRLKPSCTTSARALKTTTQLGRSSA